jgi:hypothetical protein
MIKQIHSVKKERMTEKRKQPSRATPEAKTRKDVISSFFLFLF